MSDFADELRRRINAARQALARAQADGEYYEARVYSGELDSLLRIATENDVQIPADTD